MSNPEQPGDRVTVEHKVIAIDNHKEWLRLTNSCRVDLAALRRIHSLEDYPDTELVVPFESGEGHILISRSSEHVSIVASHDDGAQPESQVVPVIVLEADLPIDDEPAVRAVDQSGRLVLVEVDDDGVGAVAGLLSELNRAIQSQLMD